MWSQKYVSTTYQPTRLDQGPGIVVIGRLGPQVQGPHRDELRLRCRRKNGSCSISRNAALNIPSLTLQCTPTINFVCISGHEGISDDSQRFSVIDITFDSVQGKHCQLSTMQRPEITAISKRIPL